MNFQYESLLRKSKVNAYDLGKSEALFKSFQIQRAAMKILHVRSKSKSTECIAKGTRHFHKLPRVSKERARAGF